MRHLIERQVRDLAKAAKMEVDLDIRWDKRLVALIEPQLAPDNAKTAGDLAHPLLSNRPRATEVDCLRLLGATLHMGRRYSGELEDAQRTWRAAFRQRRSFWRTRANGFEKSRMLHMCAFAVRVCCVVTRFWNRQDFVSARTLQMRISRGGKVFLHYADEALVAYMTHTTRWCCALHQETTVPR